MDKKNLLIILTIIILLSCENPIKAGLGTKVDITPPEIKMALPANIGGHVKGVFDLAVNAKDDVGVGAVFIAVTVDRSGNSLVDQQGNPLPGLSLEWAPAIKDPLSENWLSSIDTRGSGSLEPYPDGDLPLLVKAVDNSGKAATFEAMYIVKNNPPSMEVQVPAMSDEELPELVTGGVLIGIATDLWGVAPGYPKIQFWPADLPESQAPSADNMADWKALDKYGVAGSWTELDNAKDREAASRRALEFRYNAVDHSAPETGGAQRPSLDPGSYHYRFLTMDAAGDVFYYPPASSEKTYYELLVVRGREDPTIDYVYLENDYQKNAFKIQALIGHSMGISRADEFSVKKDGEPGDPHMLDFNLGPNEPTADGKKKERFLESFEIKAGEPYHGADGYVFTDGVYEFKIKVLSNQGSETEKTYRVYIDTTGPEIPIAQVEGAYKTSARDTHLVNGVVRVEIGNPLEANGFNQIGGSNGPRELRYLLSADPAYDTNTAEELYVIAGDGQYFDNPPSPPAAIPPASTQAIWKGGYNSIIVDTTKLDDMSSWFLYIIGKDKAGNYGGAGNNIPAKLTLNVDQGTDIPRIVIRNFDITIRTKDQHTAANIPNRTPNSLTAGRTIQGTLEDDDGIFLDGVDPIVFNYEPHGTAPANPRPLFTLNHSSASYPNKVVEFEIELPEGIADDNYTLEFIVRDDVLAKNRLLPTRNLADRIVTTTDTDPLKPYNETRTLFILDTLPPTLVEDVLNTDSHLFRKGKFDIGGYAQDFNGVKNLVITQRKGSGEAITIYNHPSSGFAAGNGSNPYALADLPWDAAGNTMTTDVDGIYFYEILATDISGKTTSPLKREVQVDTTLPKLSAGSEAITAPANIELNSAVNGWIDSVDALKGIVWDNFSVNTLYYMMKPLGSGVPTLGGPYGADTAQTVFADAANGWSSLNIRSSNDFNTNWNIPIYPADAPIGNVEGKYAVYIAVFDEAGNQINNWIPPNAYTAYAPFVFGVDIEAPLVSGLSLMKGSAGLGGPLVSEENIHTGINSMFAIQGTVTDTNALQSIKVYQKKDGSPEEEIVLTAAELTKTNLKSWDLAIGDLPRTLGNTAAAQTAPLDNGKYTYRIEALDITGSSSPVLPRRSEQKFLVTLDTVGPATTIASPGEGASISGNTLKISGAATDAVNPDGVQVYYTIANGTGPITPHATAALAAADTAWRRATADAIWDTTITLDPGVSGEGEKRAHFVAYDKLDNLSLVSKAFFIDFGPPWIDAWISAKITAPGSTVLAQDNYVFNFKALDTNGVKAVTVTRNGNPLVTADGLSINTANPNAWDVTLAVTAQADGDYVYGIEIEDFMGKFNTATNAPGNTAFKYKEFTVRVDTTGPVLTVVDPVANMSATGNKIYIGGTAPDDLTTDGIAVYYLIDSVANTAAPRDKDEAIATWAAAPGGAFWSTNADLLAGAEGNRYAHVIAYDKLGNASGVDPVHRQFFVDVNPPQISGWVPDATINYGSTPYYAGKGYTIQFNAYDSNTMAGGDPAGSQSLVTIIRNGVALDEGVQAGYTLAINRTDPKTWPVSLILTDQSDGNYTYSIEIRDATGKENTLDNSTAADTTDDHKSFTIVVDSTPPNTSLTMNPATVDNEGMDFVIANPTLLRSDNVNGVVEFAAGAMDPSGLEGVKWFLIPDGDTPAFNPGPASTNAELLALYNDGRGTAFAGNTYAAMKDTTALMDQQVYSLYIMSKDKAGNVAYNGTTAFTFYVDQRTDRPVAILGNLSKELPTDPDPVIRDGFILRGAVKDDDGVDPGTLKISFYNGAEWFNGTTWDYYPDPDLAPLLAIPPANITGSGRELSFTYNFPAMATDGPGKKVMISASDLFGEKVGHDNTAHDTANAVKTGGAETTFDLDTAKPVISVAEAIDSTYKAEAAGIHGVLTEMHPDVFRLSLDGGEYVNHIVDPDPDAGPLVLTGWNSTNGVGNWVYRLPILDTPPLSIGLHTITLEAVDKAGLTTTYLWRFYVDNSGPAISFRIDEVPYPSWGTVPTGMNIIRETAMSLRGDFRDEFSGVFTDSFEYRFDDDAAAWHTTTSTTGAIANPGRNPSWTLFLDNLPAPISGVIPDGAHRVQIRAKDVLENSTTSAWIGFRVDTADPSIPNLLPLEADAVFGNSGVDPVFTLSGTTADANLAGIGITLGGVTTPITVSAGATSVNWSHAVTAAVFGALPEGGNRFTITATDEAGRTKSVDWNFIKDTQPPVVEWSNLNNQTGSNSALFQDIANLKILGVARDSNGLTVLTSALEKWNGTAFVQVQGASDLAPNNEPVVNWVKDVTAAGLTPPLDGLYRIRINATDRGGNDLAATERREFWVDLAMPTVTIDSGSGAHPLKNFYNGKGTVAAPIGSGPIIVSGAASDANGITGVFAKLSGNNAPPWAEAPAAFNQGAGVWEVTIPNFNGATELAQGGYTLNVSATDGAGRTNTTYGTFNYDSIDPTAAIDTPPKSARVNGSITIRGSNNDSGTGLEELWYQFKKSETVWKLVAPGVDGWGTQSGLYSWNFTFNYSQVMNSSDATEVSYDPGTEILSPQSGTGLWQMPFKIKVIDHAGNEKIIDDYFLLVDQFGDVPKLAISSPDPGAILGGVVYISGTATDNFYVNKIQYRIKANPSMAPGEMNAIPWIDGANGFLTGGGHPAPSVTWQFNINGDGSLNPGAGQGMRPVLIQVRPVDASQATPNVPALEGDPIGLLIYFDAGVPRIGGEQVTNNHPANTIAKPYIDGIQVSKKFIFEAEINDDSGLDSIQYWKDGTASAPNVIGQSEVTPPTVKNAGSFIMGRKYMIKELNGTDFTLIGANTNTVGSPFTATGAGSGGGTAYEATVGQEFVYKLRLEIDSNMSPSAYVNKTGYYTINILAFDNSSPPLRADKNYTIQVDNFYPFGTYTSPNVAAGWYNLRGVAQDFDATSGPIQGLDKVVVYLSRNGTPIALKENGVNGSADNWSGTTQVVRNTVDPGVTTVPFPANIQSGITIDRDEQGSGIDQDVDGYVEAWYDNGADRVWSARFDTLQLRDGPVTVHYVIFDKAGNATYYEQTLFIKNHAPTIQSVTLGTDVFGDKTIEGTRLHTTGYFTNPAFVARNQRLSFKIVRADGNGAVHYRISPVAQQQVAVIVAGEIYTIAVPGSTDWVNLGAENNNAGTTFVATAGVGSTGTGSAYRYNTVAWAEVKQADFLSYGTSNETDTIVYSNFAGIPDAENTYFLVKVWDSTVNPGLEDQQLSDMVVVRVKVENNDGVSPTSRLYDLSPHAKNQSRYDIATTIGNAGPGGIGEDQNMSFGGLYLDANNAISGHVEPRGASAGPSIFLETGVPSTFNLDTVSGKVILRGSARDNQRISAIQVQFGTAPAIKIIQVDTTPSTISTGHFRALEPVSTSGVRAWVYDDLSLDEHLVEWAYEWDTQNTVGMAIVGNITVRAIALDARVANYAATPYPLNPNTSASFMQNAWNNVDYNTIAMTAAPYISGLTTALSAAYPTRPSVFNRSALGLYPVRDTETITINGFNLGGASTTVKIGNTTLGRPTVGSSAANQIRVPIGNTAVSGALVATLGGVDSVNNKNNNDATFNQEPNGMNNSILTDNRELYVWNTGALINRKDLTNPFMRLDSSSAYYMSYGGGATSMFFNKGGIETLFEQCFNKFHNTTVAFDASGNYYGGATNTDRINDTGGATSFTFYSRAPGNFVTGAAAHYDGNQGIFVPAREVFNKRHLELSYNATTAQYNINRVQIPRIAITGAGTAMSPAKIYMSYFDGNNNANPVVFRYGTSIAANTLTGGIATQVTSNNPGTAAAAQVVANSGTAAKGGLYTAVGALRTGRSVIAWYDAVNQQLVYSYSPTDDPSNVTTTSWQNNAKIIDADFAGWYVDLAVDDNATQGIHIAYYSSNGGDLKYAYLPSYDATPQVVTVDSYLSAGTKLMINIRREAKLVNGFPTMVYVPYISYYHASFPQTPFSVRVVWRNNFDQLLDGAVADNFTGNWEAMTVPTPNVPIDDFICNGVPLTGMFTGNINLTNSVVLGYMTNQFYERAYIKK